jgi:hypothetical protein
MTRPVNTEDLPDYERKGHLVARIESSYITRHPSLGQHLLAALAEADHLGLVVDDGEIIIPLTEAELDRKVKSAQDSWDFGKEVYEKFIEDGVWPERAWSWGAYLRAEGIAAPTKEEAAK